MWLQVAYTYTAEMFPTRARSSGFAVSAGLVALLGPRSSRERPEKLSA